MKKLQRIVSAVALGVAGNYVFKLLNENWDPVSGSILVIVGAGIWLLLFRTSPPSEVNEDRALLSKMRSVHTEYSSAIQKSIPIDSFLPIHGTWISPHDGFDLRVNLAKHISDIVDRFHSLVIVGKAGSGKTLIMLKLFDELLKCAEWDPEQPVPVMLNLSTWKPDHRTLKPWMISELNGRHKVSKETVARLVDDNKLIILLDGLDELYSSTAQTECVEAINRSLTEMGAWRIVLCSRFLPDSSIIDKLSFRGKICLEPIGDSDLNTYLDKVKLNPALRNLLSTDHTLQDFLENPWTLNLMIMVTRALPHEHLTGNRKQLFNLFIKYQFLTKESERPPFTGEDVVEGLSWTAKKMLQRSGTPLLIEDLQPGWLTEVTPKSGGVWFLLYFACSRVAGALTAYMVGVGIMLVTCFVGFILSDPNDTNWCPSFGLLNVQQGLPSWIIITSVAGGLTMAGVDLFRLARNQGSSEISEKGPVQVFKFDMTSIIANSLICACVFFLCALGFRFQLQKAIYGALIYGMAFGLVFWFRGRSKSDNDIHTAEDLSWSHKGLLRGAVAGFCISLPLMLVAAGIILWISGPTPAFHLTILGWTTGTVIGAIIASLRKVSMQEQITKPNEGLIRSAYNAMWMSLFIGLPFVLIYWTYGMLSVGVPKVTLVTALFFGLVIGMLLGFAYGGLDIVYHFVLRFILRLKGLPTIRFVRFLEYGSHLAFLQRIQGSYMFTHNTLRDHFANLTDADKKEIGFGSSRGEPVWNSQNKTIDLSRNPQVDSGRSSKPFSKAHKRSLA